MSRHNAVLLTDIHAFFRAFDIFEAVPDPFARNEVRAESVFKMRRIVAVIEYTDKISVSFAQCLRITLPLFPIVPRIDDFLLRTDSFCFVNDFDALSDSKRIHQLRHIFFKFFQTRDIIFEVSQARSRSSSFTSRCVA